MSFALSNTLIKSDAPNKRTETHWNRPIGNKLQIELTNGRTKKSITSDCGRFSLIAKCSVCASGTMNEQRELSDLHASNHNLFLIYFLIPCPLRRAQFLTIPFPCVYAINIICMAFVYSPFPNRATSQFLHFYRHQFYVCRTVVAPHPFRKDVKPARRNNDQEIRISSFDDNSLCISYPREVLARWASEYVVISFRFRIA